MGGVFYPQCSMILLVRWEDFGDKQTESLKSVYSLPILARRVTVSINDYTQADTFDAEIDYKNFPFDPRTIRSCGVKIFMQDIGQLYKYTNEIEKIAPDTKNAVFIGFADEESISFDDTKRTVRLEGRDFTSLFIDRKYIKGTLPQEQRVDVVLQSILDELPENRDASSKIVLDNRVKDESGNLIELPVLSAFEGEKDKLSGKRNVGREKTYWDVIQELASHAGLLCYIELDKLVLTKPRNLYDKKQITHFVYGKNLSNLEFKRKLGRRKGFNIIVRSFSEKNKEVITAKIPLEATEEWSKATGISNTENKVQEVKPDGTAIPEAEAKPAQYISFLLKNISDKDHLIEVGQEVYEEIGRQQIDGSFETQDMVTAGANKTIFDILKLRNGTPVSIEIDQGDLKGISSLTSKAERVRFLKNRGYDASIADVFADTLGKMATPFYTKAVTFTMDGTTGFKCKVDFINFIETTNKAFSGKT